MNKLQGLLISVLIHTISYCILGASISASLVLFHVAVVPLVFKYSKTFRRNLIFTNFVEWPLNINYKEPEKNGILGARNLSVEYYSKVDKIKVMIGIWHILPLSSCERLKGHLKSTIDREKWSKMMDVELANSEKPIILYCHGNSNSRGATHRIELYKTFQRMDFHTITFDYRGYGDSTNLKPSEDGVVEDSLVVYEWLNNTLESELRSEAKKPPVFIWGHSLGTGISSNLVGNLKDLSTSLLMRATPIPPPNGLILEAPFNNIADEVHNHPLAKLIWWLPYYDQAIIEPFRKSPEYQFRSDEHLSKVTDLPIIILHAKDDSVVPYLVGKKLYDAVLSSRCRGGAPVVMHVYPACEGWGHKWICHAPDLPQVIGDFVDKHR